MGGIRVRIAVTVTNQGDAVTEPLWIVIESTGRSRTFPVVVSFEPGKGQDRRYGYDGVIVRGPAIRPDRPVRLRVDVMFGSPLDVPYRVSIVTAGSLKSAKAAYEAGDIARSWRQTVESTDC